MRGVEGRKIGEGENGGQIGEEGEGVVGGWHVQILQMDISTCNPEFFGSALFTVLIPDIWLELVAPTLL
jgi:hypothetical protein